MKNKIVKQLLMICITSSLMISNPMMIWASDNAESVIVEDSDAIKSVQTILNALGYNCGNADGVMGNQTIAAIKKFQSDQGLDATGKINSELLDCILAGIPLNIFSDRYNTAVIYTNKAINSTLQYCNFDENTEEYCPNGNLSLILNPNVVSRKMVGNINVYSKNDFDSDMAIGELGAALYAFDISLATPNDAITLINNIFSSDGAYTADGITFTNYSFKGMVAIKAEYDTYSSSSISKDFRSNSNEDKTTTENSSNAKNKYSHEHYDTSTIDDEEIPDALNIKNSSDMNNLLGYIGQTRSSVEDNIGVEFDKNHLYESSEQSEYYKVNGSIGKYIGEFSFSIDKGTNIISHIAFKFDKNDVPIEVEPVVQLLTDLLEKEYDQFVRPSIVAGNYTWNENGCKIKIYYNEIDDDKYPGANFINFN